MGLADETDTLGRWMAHHLAELLDQAERAPTDAARRRARRSAESTILRLWQHRAALPGNAYPLAPFATVLRLIERLQPSDNPFRVFSYRGETRAEQQAAIMFDNLARLVIVLLLMRAPATAWSAEIDSTAYEALCPEEQQVLTALHQWGALFAPAPRGARRRRTRPASGDTGQSDLTQSAVDFIADAIQSLNELRAVLSADE